MSTTEVMVQYDRKFSDQNYGSEGLSMSVTLPIDMVQLGDGILEEYAVRLRIKVLTELAHSSSHAVARAAQHELNNPPALGDVLEPVSVGGPRDDDDEDEEPPF